MKYLIFLGITILIQNAMAQIPPPEQPVYEQCPQISSADGNGGTTLQTDYACQSRNSVKQRNYSVAVDAYNRANRIITADSSGLNKPAEPKYENCENIDSNGNAIYDYACQSRNSALQNDYNLQSSGYNEATKQQAARTQQSELLKQQEEQRLQQAKAQAEASAKAAAEEAEKRNKAAADTYKKSSQSNMLFSGAMAAAFASTCPTCQYSLLALSIAHAIFSGQAKKQANSNSGVAFNACTVAAKVASESKTCVPEPPYNPIADINSIYDSSTGKCIGNKSDCDRLASILPKGTNIKDALKGLSSFASSNPPFKINPDGSVIGKDGKKYGLDSFNSENDLIAAGVSPSDAKALFAKLKNSAAADANADLNSQSALSKLNANSVGAGYGDNSSSNGSGKTTEILLNGNASDEKDFVGSGKKRELASAEGLAKDFNGEPIGVAGDDIFKMMNRRYKLKVSQGNFIFP